MRASDVRFIEVESRLKLPAQLEVGAVYFVMDEGLLIVNHGGGRIVEYGKVNDSEGLPETGFWAVAQGGTGSVTAAGARANLGALGKTENAVTASALQTGRDIELVGAVTGKATFTGASNIAIVTSADHRDLETKDNKAILIQPAAFATDERYPSEKAVRTELDKKIGKNEAISSFRGIFATPAALTTGIPVGTPGDYAIVSSTSTTWTWNNNPGAWADSGQQIAEGIKAVNGLQGAAIMLDVEEHLDGYKATTIEDKLDLKQDKLEDNVKAGLDAAGLIVTGTNRFATMGDIDDASLPPEVSGLPPRVTALEENMTGVMERQSAVKVATSQMALSKILNGITVVGSGQLNEGPPYAVGRTLVKDLYGTLGSVSAILEDGVEVTTVTTSFIGSSIPILLGNIATRELLPGLQSQSLLVFNREASVGDRCRIITDSNFGGATTELYVLTVGTETDPVLTWGNELILNTSDYQLAAPASLAGFVPTMGSTPGTWGPGFDPRRLYFTRGGQIDLYLPGMFCANKTLRALKDVARDRYAHISLDEPASLPGVRTEIAYVLPTLATPGTGTIQIYRVGRGYNQADRLNITKPINLEGLSQTWAYIDPLRDPVTNARPAFTTAATENSLEIEILETGTAQDLRIQLSTRTIGPGDPVR